MQKDTMLHLRRMGGVVSFWYVCPYLFRYGLFLYKSDEVGLLQMRDRISVHLSLRICVHAPQGNKPTYMPCGIKNLYGGVIV